MAVADNYRAKALELRAKADGETNQRVKTEFKNLAAAYLRLAEQAKRNDGLTIIE